MAVFQDVFPDTQELFDGFIGKIESLNEVSIKILGNNKLKEPYKVVKATDLTRYLSTYDIVIIVNESVFELLDEENKQMIIEESVARIYYDMEKGKVSIINPDMSTFSLLVVKFGIDKYIRLQQMVREIFQQQADAASNG